MPAIAGDEDDLFPCLEGQVHLKGFPALVGVLVGGKSSLSAAAALAFRLVVHRHVHIEVPDIVGEDELGLRQGLFLVHLDFQRGGGCHSAKAHGHGAVRLARLHRRLFHSTDQLIDVKRQMYHLAF